MNARSTVLLCGVAALSAGLLGCACGRRHDRGDGRDAETGRYSETTTSPARDVSTAPARTTVDPYAASAPDSTTSAQVAVTFEDAAPETYPQRSYYYDPSDYDHMYYYDRQTPDSYMYRQVYRDRGRSYYLEHADDRLLERRVFFDDNSARATDVRRPQSERAPLERNARERDQTERADWTKRSASAPQRTPPSPQPAPAPTRDPSPPRETPKGGR